MATEKKVKIVESLQETFSKCSVGIITDYRGLTTAELDDLRRQLREAKVEYKVVKNSLAQFAVKNSDMDYLVDSFQGPVAIAFGYDEEAKVAKIITEYIRNTKSVLNVKGGFLPDRLLSAREVDTLAKLPSREILISQALAGMKSPIYGLVNVLAGPIRGIMGVLQARMKQLEEA